jgi:lipopolysaccharide/colanic/teichoic acid biosynthesis glycosyltransferase
MHINTPVMATHKMTNPNEFLTPIGGFLRQYSLDELPQLFSILKGDMSFVGPRPALFNQDDLNALRTKNGVDMLVPGLTGWAQVNGRDDLPVPEKVALDFEFFVRIFYGRQINWVYLNRISVMMRRGGASNSGLSSIKLGVSEINRSLSSNHVWSTPIFQVARYFIRFLELIVRPKKNSWNSLN